MNTFWLKNKERLIYRFFSYLLIFTFSISFIYPPQVAQAQVIPQLLGMPTPGAMLHVSTAYEPTIIQAMTIDPTDPFRFTFIMKKGDDDLQGEAFKEATRNMVKYFLASLTVPEDEVWVNLSPYEKDRIIPEGFGQTEMGRDMLAQDYILKQLTASLVYPEDELGEKFWERIRTRAQEEFGTEEIPMATFNKVWIMPESATVYEHENTVFVVEKKLKVMLEEDYLAMSKSEQWTVASDQLQSETTDHRALSTKIIREIIIPELEREVNEGKHFAQLRQIYNSNILAVWYKEHLKVSILNQIYANKNKISGVNVDDPSVKEKIYNQYVEAFKKGAFDYIKEDYDPATQTVMAKKYFSGGMTAFNGSSGNKPGNIKTTKTPPSWVKRAKGAFSSVVVALAMAGALTGASMAAPTSADAAFGNRSVPVDIQRSSTLPGPSALVLQEAEFDYLGDGYYQKGRYLVQLDSDGSILSISSEINDMNYSGILSISIEEKYREKELIVYNQDGYIYEVNLQRSRGGSSSGNDASEFKRSPLFERDLRKAGFVEQGDGTGVFMYAHEGRTTSVVIKNKKIVLISQLVEDMVDRYQKNAEIIRYEITNEGDSADVYDSLILKQGPLVFVIGIGKYSAEYMKMLSFDSSVELDLQLTDQQTYQEPANKAGFVIGGGNSTQTIEGLAATGLTGLSIGEIEQRARPGSYSDAGFIGATESFLERLKTDNTFIKAQGLTHKQMAEPLFYVINLLDAVMSGSRWHDNAIEFTYKGESYKASYMQTRGVQLSIFNDDITASRDYQVTNLQTGESLSFSPMVAYYIARYGFYEGDTPYRVDPVKVISAFGLTDGSTSNAQRGADSDVGDSALTQGDRATAVFTTASMVIPVSADAADTSSRTAAASEMSELGDGFYQKGEFVLRVDNNENVVDVLGGLFPSFVDYGMASGIVVKTQKYIKGTTQLLKIFLSDGKTLSYSLDLLNSPFDGMTILEAPSEELKSKSLETQLKEAGFNKGENSSVYLRTENNYTTVIVVRDNKVTFIGRSNPDMLNLLKLKSKDRSDAGDSLPMSGDQADPLTAAFNLAGFGLLGALARKNSTDRGRPLAGRDDPVLVMASLFEDLFGGPPGSLNDKDFVFDKVDISSLKPKDFSDDAIERFLESLPGIQEAKTAMAFVLQTSRDKNFNQFIETLNNIGASWNIDMIAGIMFHKNYIQRSSLKTVRRIFGGVVVSAALLAGMWAGLKTENVIDLPAGFRGSVIVGGDRIEIRQEFPSSESLEREPTSDTGDDGGSSSEENSSQSDGALPLAAGIGALGLLLAGSSIRKLDPDDSVDGIQEAIDQAKSDGVDLSLAVIDEFFLEKGMIPEGFVTTTDVGLELIDANREKGIDPSETIARQTIESVQKLVKSYRDAREFADSVEEEILWTYAIMKIQRIAREFLDNPNNFSNEFEEQYDGEFTEKLGAAKEWWSDVQRAWMSDQFRWTVKQDERMESEIEGYVYELILTLIAEEVPTEKYKDVVDFLSEHLSVHNHLSLSPTFESIGLALDPTDSYDDEVVDSAFVIIDKMVQQGHSESSYETTRDVFLRLIKGYLLEQRDSELIVLDEGNGFPKLTFDTVTMGSAFREPGETGEEQTQRETMLEEAVPEWEKVAAQIESRTLGVPTKAGVYTYDQVKVITDKARLEQMKVKGHNFKRIMVLEGDPSDIREDNREELFETAVHEGEEMVWSDVVPEDGRNGLSKMRVVHLLSSAKTNFAFYVGGARTITEVEIYYSRIEGVTPIHNAMIEGASLQKLKRLAAETQDKREAHYESIKHFMSSEMAEFARAYDAVFLARVQEEIGSRAKMNEQLTAILRSQGMQSSQSSALRTLINEIPGFDSILRVVLKRNAFATETSVDMTLAEFFNQFAEGEVENIRIASISINGYQGIDDASVLVQKFSDGWIQDFIKTSEGQEMINEVQITLASGMVVLAAGNVAMLYELARNNDVVKIELVEAKRWMPGLWDISEERRKAGTDWKSEYRNQLQQLSLSNKSDLPGETVFHGTVEGFVASVQDGPQDVGKGFGGQGLYLAFGETERTIAEQYAKFAEIAVSARQSQLPSRFVDGDNAKRKIVLEGRINPDVDLAKLRVGRFQVSANAFVPDFENSILPALWADDPNLQAMMIDMFDALDVRGMRSNGLNLDTDRILVVHESAGADFIQWDGGLDAASTDEADAATSTPAGEDVAKRELDVRSETIVDVEQQGNFIPSGKPVVVVAEDTPSDRERLKAALLAKFGDNIQLILTDNLEAAKKAVGIAAERTLLRLVVSDFNYPHRQVGDSKLYLEDSGPDLVKFAKNEQDGVVVVLTSNQEGDLAEPRLNGNPDESLFKPQFEKGFEAVATRLSDLLVGGEVAVGMMGVSPTGGIDFNPASLNLKVLRDEGGVPLPLFEQPAELMNIEGFYPVILQILPANVPLLLGMADESDDGSDATNGLSVFDREDSAKLLELVNG